MTNPPPSYTTLRDTTEYPARASVAGQIVG